MTVVPAANSEEGFARATQDVTDPAERIYARWATAEWVYEAAGDEHFDAANEALDAPDGETLLASMTEGLRQLDAEGFFGRSAAREQVTLFVSVSDSDEAEAVETSSARQLNPPVVAAAFAARYA